ncbi:MAG: hypothetical protein ACLTDF_02480 [Coprococcus sp.]
MSLCDLVGIKNHVRIANRDPGAGGGHRNVVALCDGKLYIADAGYVGDAPRGRDLYETTAFSNDNGVLYQYDGFDDDIVIQMVSPQLVRKAITYFTTQQTMIPSQQYPSFKRIVYIKCCIAGTKKLRIICGRCQ